MKYIILSILCTLTLLYAKNVTWDRINDKESILFRDKNSSSIIIIIKECFHYCKSVWLNVSKHGNINLKDGE